MIKVDKDKIKIKMEGVGVDIQCDIALVVCIFASDMAKMSDGCLTKKEGAEMRPLWCVNPNGKGAVC